MVEVFVNGTRLENVDIEIYPPGLMTEDDPGAWAVHGSTTQRLRYSHVRGSDGEVLCSVKIEGREAIAQLVKQGVTMEPVATDSYSLRGGFSIPVHGGRVGGNLGG